MPRLLVLPLLVCTLLLAAACSRDATPLEDGERLWREGVWRPQTVGFGPCIPRLEQAVIDTEGMPSRQTAFLLASAYVFSGRAAEAEPLMPIVRSGPPAPEPMLIDGFLAMQRHARPDAEIALSACLARISEDHAFRDELLFLTLLWRGEERYAVGDLDGAIADLEPALRVAHGQGAPPHRILTGMLVTAYRGVRDYPRAEEIARDAAERDPAWAPHAYELGLVCELQARTKDARFWYDESVRRDPRYPPPHVKLARLAFEAGELERGREHLDLYDDLTRAEQQKSGQPRGHGVDCELAAGSGVYWMRVAAGQKASGAELEAIVSYGRAREALRRAAEIDADSVRAIARLIEVGRILGEDEAVLARWEKALAESPERPELEPGPADAHRTFR